MRASDCRDQPLHALVTGTVDVRGVEHAAAAAYVDAGRAFDDAELSDSEEAIAAFDEDGETGD